MPDFTDLFGLMLFIGLYRKPDDQAEVWFKKGKKNVFRIKTFNGRNQLCRELNRYRKDLLARTAKSYLGIELYNTTGRRFAIDLEIPEDFPGVVVLSVSELEDGEPCRRFYWRGSPVALADALMVFSGAGGA
ncbi:hypothetical protein [Pedobacter sp. JY14-1]|uniref:hypothetical protein n=1 Tax=Pedobacter sp. JY14-1 TaxID=3034151 RepID=UPI0023E2F1C0|nr:hypothetical protein [Pedobacter sp. JY14-1]